MKEYSSLEKAYDDYLWEKRIGEQAERKEGIKGEVVHASEIPYCMRAIVLGMLGLSEWDRKQLKSVLRIFENGKYFHDRMQDALKAKGVLTRCEEFVYNEKFGIGGSIDGVALLSGMDHIAEFKSMNSWGYGKNELPLDQHKMQASIYMFCSGIYKTRFMYENKDNQGITEVTYALEEEMLEAAIRRAREAWWWFRKTTDVSHPVLPPMECLLKSDSKAKRCLTRKGCFNHVD